MQEDCRSEGDALLVCSGADDGDHIRRMGEDYRAGDLLLRKGSPLGPAAIGLLGSDGHGSALVWKPPKVGLLVTGNELVSPDQPIEPGQIYDSNTSALSCALQKMGCHDIESRRCSDDLVATTDALSELLACCDIVVTVGGLAVGDRDHIPAALSSLDVQMLFRKVAIKPGKPVTTAVANNKPVFCLPGNPVSALVMLFAFVRPAIAHGMGLEFCEKWVRLEACAEIRKKAGRAELVPGSRSGSGFSPVGVRGSHLLQELSGAGSLALIDSEVEKVHENQMVNVVDWRWEWA